ncbi:MAG: hypothetical protein BGO37_05870 [Cellulomonas sp. 73-92]|uniref:CAP domain-containing protein n=1 Tax=Cellulomonas sp. 73-92 TaxID=1895740 RepID=UPI00092A47DD|nr:CAP domain-containing protein [Cellulomonas sp. 73-92]OJV81471.1 MAG: hypothetical protein BGO37_05870 [Cellulomonas sp. 73-92]
MALTRRVAATSVPHQKTSLDGTPEGEPAVIELTGTGVGPAAPLLDHVPTQRSVFPQAEPETLDAPASLPPTTVAEPAPDRRRGRAGLIVVAVTVSGALIAASIVVAHDRAVRIAERQAADIRLAADRAAQESDFSARYAAQQAAATAWSNALAAARRTALAAAADGTQQLTAAVHADPTLVAALQAAIGLATSTAADPSASVADISAAAAGVAAPAKAVTVSEAAWQAADQARIAAEQQAAAQAAAVAKAAAAQPVVKKPVATKPVTSSGTVPAPSGGTVQPIPAGGLVCPGAPVGAGVGESSYSAIGAAINAWRAGQGLPALAISRSSTLVAHAEDMAASGGIWHSGYDNIVGCTSGSVASLIDAWANSAPHRAQMLRTDVSRMLIGGASSGGWLYGAVKFS